MSEKKGGSNQIPLNEYEKGVLNYITCFLEQHGHEPSYAQICSQLGIKSKATIARHLASLEKRGLLNTRPSEKQKNPNVEPDKKCEVHGEVMKAMKVPFIYGTPIMNEAFRTLIDDRASLFPNARSHFLGGCQLGSRGPAMEALVCAQCREAERQWAESTGLPTEPDIGGFFIAG